MALGIAVCLLAAHPLLPQARPAVNLSLYCDVAQAATLAGVTDRQVRNAIKDGRIEASKVGHVWMVLRSSAQAFQRVPGMGRPKKQQAKRRRSKRR